jgi:putative tricarboxylic transport membrane protein
MLLVITLSGDGMVKGMIAATLGMAISIVGFSPMDGAARLTFNQVSLTGGFAIVPVIVGLFAVSQIIREVSRKPRKLHIDFDVKGMGVTLREVRDNLWNILRSSMIGVWIGVLPGIGSSASSVVAWAVAKQSSKHPEEFGKGSVEGIWASETSNNANVGGSLLPLLTLGIPGDAVTALMIAGFMIHGLQPGPLLFVQQPVIISDIYAAFLYATIVVLVFQIATLRIFPRILQVPPSYLLPIMVVLTVVGAYSADNQESDILVMLGFGMLGLLLERYGFPIAVLVLGYILGPILELNLRRSLTFEGGDLTPFVTRPISAALLVLTVVALTYILYGQYRRGRLKYEDD